MTAGWVGLGLIAAGLLLLGFLAVTHRPDPDDPWRQPHREVEAWPQP